MSRYNYRRRETHTVSVGGISIGGNNPIRLQSMTNTPTLDTEESARCVCAIANAGGEIVRLTTQGEREAANLKNIGLRVNQLGINVPLVADVHFNPKAAYVAAATCQKVRINPGNFIDPGRTYKKLEFTDEEYAAELKRIDDALSPLLDICKQHGTALRLGVNHGSLSDRIMSRYGDTPEGMTESAMEFLRSCKKQDFNNIVISIKASNVVVMVHTVRLLIAAMDAEDMHYPLHLGVTEAGDGEDGRIKSAVGIGTLLSEGIGDTIRVSLSEAPEAEIPVAKALRDYIYQRHDHTPIIEPKEQHSEPSRNHATKLGDLFPVIGLDNVNDFNRHISINASEEPNASASSSIIVLSSSHQNPVGEMSAWIDRYYERGGQSPIILKFRYDGLPKDEIKLRAAADCGTMLMNGYGNGIWIESDVLNQEECNRVSLAILQACRLRISKTEYIACPGCGRTLFDLPQTLQQVREATKHLTHLKIGVMGCVVNGPGEMADADYGYVGAGRGRVSIYKNKTLMVKNIPTEDALDALKQIIKEHGDWIEP